MNSVSYTHLDVYKRQAQRKMEIASHALFSETDPMLLKPKSPQILVDEKYILAAMGLFSTVYPDAALRIMKKEMVNYGNGSSKPQVVGR